MKLKLSALSLAGGKPVNQDDVLLYSNIHQLFHSTIDEIVELQPNEVLFCGVADGVSSCKLASQASHIALNSIKEQTDFHNPNEFITNANRNVCSLNKSQNIDAACTISCAFIHATEKTIQFANVGDSPIYLLKHHNLEQMAMLHTLATLKEKMNISNISPSDHNTLLNYLGNIEVSNLANLFEMNMMKDDIYFICTDGVSNALSQVQLKDLLLQKDLKKLMDIVLENASDNCSAIFIQVLEI